MANQLAHIMRLLMSGCPENYRKELANKYEAYEEAGVKEYWVIQPQEKTFLKYILTYGNSRHPG